MYKSYDINDWYTAVPKGLRKPLKLVELIFPHSLRTLLGTKKELLPASLAILLENSAYEKKYSDYLKIKELILSIGITGENGIYWSHPYTHHGENWEIDNIKKSCLHHNIMILRSLMLGEKLLKDDSYSLVKKCISECIHLHWKEKSQTFSYYPSSEDEIINIQCDMLHLLNEFKTIYKDNEFITIQKMLNGTILRIRDEKFFFYGTESHYNKYNDAIVEDSHHAAMSLIALFRSSQDDLKLKDKAINLTSLFETKFLRYQTLKKYSNKNMPAQLNGYVELLKLSNITTLKNIDKVELKIDRIFKYGKNYAPQTFIGIKIKLDSIRYGREYVKNAKYFIRNL